MRAELLEVGDPRWAAVLGRARHDVYHLPEYVALSAAHEGGRPVALHATDGERDILLPLLVRPIPGGGTDAGSPYGYPGPVGDGLDRPAFVRAAMRAWLPVLRRAGVVSVFVRLHPILNPSPPPEVGVVVHHGETVSVDLTLPPELVWSRTRANHRRDITRAAASGCVARIDERWEHLGAFRELYEATMERRGAAAFYRFPTTYYDGLREPLAGRAHLAVVECAGRIGAAGVFFETDGIVQYHLSGSAPVAAALQPTKLMIHFVEGWARERGDRVLHLGGGVGGRADSLFQFKLGFSPRRHDFSTLRIVVEDAEYRRLVAARDPGLDPADLTGFFPAYRLP